MTIYLRDQDPTREDDDILVHMGAGAVDAVLNQALRTYARYRDITTSGLGVFAVSVFALVEGVTLDQILRALPQGQFATARLGDVRRKFALLPTSIFDATMTEATLALQHVHFDIVLPHPEDSALAVIDPVDMPALQRAALKTKLQIAVTKDLLPLFPLRHKK